MTYIEVYNAIKNALSGRAPGTRVSVALHELAELKILGYIEQLKASITNNSLHSAHSNSVAGDNCDLVWNTAFLNTSYDYSVNGFDADGYPVEITLVQKLPNKLVVRTLVNSTLTATAVAYSE